MDAASAARLAAASSDIPSWLPLLTGLGLGSLIGTAATLGAGVIRDNLQRAHDIALRSIDAAREKEHWRRTEAKVAYAALIGHVNELVDVLNSFALRYEYPADMPHAERDEIAAESLAERVRQSLTVGDRVQAAAIQVRLVGPQETCDLAVEVALSCLDAIERSVQRSEPVREAIDKMTDLLGRFLTAARSEFLAVEQPHPKAHS
jgi:hypothetical protein